MRPLALVVLLASFTSFSSIASLARADDAPPASASTGSGAVDAADAKKKAKLFWLYAGAEITWWNIEWGDQSESYRGILGGYDRQTDPYVMKALEGGFKLAGFEIGLGYLTDKLGKLLDFSSSDDLDSAEDPVSRTLRGYISYLPPIRAVRFQSNLSLRRFESRATTLGRTNVSGPPLAQTYLPLDGAAQTLQPGQTVKWFSSTRDVGLRVVVDVMELMDLDSDMMNAYVGYRRVDLVTPTDVFISSDALASSVLLGARSICSGAELGIQSGAPAEEGLSFFYDIPVYWGSFSLESQYFDSSGGYCMAFGGELGVRYRSGPLGFDVGGKYVKIASASEPGGNSVTTKLPMPTVDAVGAPLTLPAGSAFAIDVDRFESFSTLYFRGAYSF